MSSKKSVGTIELERPLVTHHPQMDSSEDLLWARVVKGLLVGAVIAGLLAYLLIAFTEPEVSQTAKIGLAVFVGFWSGPFIGLSAAVGYHELKKGHTAHDRPAPSGL